MIEIYLTKRRKLLVETSNWRRGAMPAGAPANGYYTWSTIGVVDHAWIMSTCVEAWTRQPTTVGVPPLPGPTPSTLAMEPLVATFNRNLNSLGFTCSKPLLLALAGLDEMTLTMLYEAVMTVLKKMVGAHRTFRPMYPNFPKQVMEADEAELYCNAMVHYLAAALRDQEQGQPRLFGGAMMEGAAAKPTLPEKELDEIAVARHWLPDYATEARAPLPESEMVTLKVIHLGTEDDFNRIFTVLVGSNGSLSEGDKEIVRWFTENRREALPRLLPDVIPQKENLALLVGLLLKHEVPVYLTSYLKTSTDVLRTAVVMSGGDVSLAENTKFRRFKRSERRFLLTALEALPSVVEDMLRRPEVWKRLGRELRPGDYPLRFPKTLQAFAVVRNPEAFPFRTFNGKVERALRAVDVQAYTDLLGKRPGDFARRLDHALRIAGGRWREVVDAFKQVAAQVSTPVLLQALAHFVHRYEPTDHRAFFPKGLVSKVKAADKPLPLLEPEVLGNLTSIIVNTLVARFKTLPPLGKVWVDPAMRLQFVPSGQRSASKSLRTIARGSRLDLPASKAIRFFVWWKEPRGVRTDIDLAATFFDAEWNYLRDISYYNLRDLGLGCAHSGDITSAPNGACEFIDLDLELLRAAADSPWRGSGPGLRYVMMNIYCYTQQPFKDLPECFAGWMARTAVRSGEIFEARTVQDKIDIAGDTTTNIPLIVDVVSRQVIWADVALKSRTAVLCGYTQRSNVSLMGKAIASLRKPTLYDLFSMHAHGRGELVAKAEDADVRFGWNGDISPFDTDRIMSELMPDPPRADLALTATTV
jgi:hypothetical protein